MLWFPSFASFLIETFAFFHKWSSCAFKNISPEMFSTELVSSKKPYSNASLRAELIEQWGLVSSWHCVVIHSIHFAFEDFTLLRVFAFPELVGKPCALSSWSERDREQWVMVAVGQPGLAWGGNEPPELGHRGMSSSAWVPGPMAFTVLCGIIWEATHKISAWFSSISTS